MHSEQDDEGAQGSDHPAAAVVPSGVVGPGGALLDTSRLHTLAFRPTCKVWHKARPEPQPGADGVRERACLTFRAAAIAILQQVCSALRAGIPEKHLATEEGTMRKSRVFTVFTVAVVVGVGACQGSAPPETAEDAKGAESGEGAADDSASDEGSAADESSDSSESAGGEEAAEEGSGGCPRGGCKFECEKGKPCSETCEGGACDMHCADDSECTLDCPTGSCKVICAPGATCNVKCAGGYCKTICPANSTCKVDCEGKGGACETECAKGATCDVNCPTNDCKGGPKKK